MALDDYDYEEEDSSSSAISGLLGSLIDSGTQLATTAINNSQLGIQTFQPESYPVYPVQQSSSGIMTLILIAAVAFILFKVL